MIQETIMNHVLKTGFFDCVLQFEWGDVHIPPIGFIELQTLMQVEMRI